MKPTKEQITDWNNWLNERPDNVKKVALKIVPWEKYKNKREKDIGNRYSPVSYDEQNDGSVTLTCEKTNEEFPPLGGYSVFGMNPNDLQES